MKLKQEGIHTAVDTCGFVSREALDEVIPYTDLFLYDIKAISEDVHISCTGQSNRAILDNLLYLDSLGKRIEIRIPYVPGYNSNEIGKIAEFISMLKNVTDVRILQYHKLAGSKYDALGLINTLPDRTPTEREIAEANELLFSIVRLNK